MTQQAKTGGNKKSASRSDEAYWLRAQNGKFAETHRAKRIARHVKRMAKKAAHRLVWLARKKTVKLASQGFAG